MNRTTHHHLPWAAFLRELDWPVTHVVGGYAALGGTPLLVRATRAADGNDLHNAVPKTESWARDRDWRADVVMVGATPLPPVVSYLACDPPAGLIGEFNADHDETEATSAGLTRKPPRWHWYPALWTQCSVCTRLGVYAETGSWTIRPCGHSDGLWHNGAENLSAIGHRWARALYTQQRRSFR